MTIAFPHPPGIGGPGSFQIRLTTVLEERGWHVVYAHQGIIPDVVMVVGGTRRIAWLNSMKRKGIPIIYRLDGIGWLHKKAPLKIRSFLLGEYRNTVNKLIHAFLATHIVYQSDFVRKWWDQEGWRKPKAFNIISNGVDLQIFKPNIAPYDPVRVVCLEGTLDYSPYAIRLLNELAEKLYDVEFHIYGGFQEETNQRKLSSKLIYHGKISRSEVPNILQGGIYLSLDVNPACPNTVIEALATGMPVLGFDTGALKELVVDNSGKIVSYGSDPWRLAYPDIDNLLDPVRKLIARFSFFSKNARRLAEERHNINKIVDEYMAIINLYTDK